MAAEGLALAEGGRETGQRHYKVMQLLHTAFLISMLIPANGGLSCASGDFP